MGHLHEAVDGVSNALMISAILPPAGPAPIINCSDILSEHCFPIMVATFVAGCITCAFTAAYGMGKDIHKVSQALLRNARVAANVATLSLSAVIVG
ncbi:MAG: hypothetical protein K0U52_12610 [Gammaproteobacteria bacterium]|nr:hypothetical protein [Gammaproteobacteria bacterium]